ncbi:hypothetical protein PFISCL1PPCAC_18476 [Pristionchus fissidentatus]|uniref:Acid ceramidase n=1 Tax=Pristionchus fissidentatus TaxID=1538716 RepID=A0AAV5W8W9_9BILA|nr:hypothetical protein PFISCL1PPCAC_18476 [Pristionchus fissidentatus]
MQPLLLLLLVAPLLAVHVDLIPPFEDHCILEEGTNLYDPKNADVVPWFDVDLDKPPSERWTEIATIYKDNIHALIKVITDLVVPIFPDVDVLGLINEVFGEMNKMIPQPYQDEITSISVAAEMPLGEVVLYNIFYEIFTVCTSVIAQDEKGKLWHARNLDFGLFLGWDPVEHEWEISAVLRKMVVNINWIKDGKILYKSNNFAGFIGIYNGMKQGKFTVTANERFMKEGGYVGIIRWLTGMEPDGKWMTWLTRETMENMEDYASAKEHLMNTPMLSPVYYILSGTKPGEGCIISRSLDKTDILSEMSAQKDPWYILQTNYDPDTEPLFLDDRQTPGDKCMKKLGKKNIGFQGIYNVLSSRTNLNKLTTYTVLMQTDTGKFETHLQACPGDCWPF